MKGGSFKKADLSWPDFDNSDLSDCDFNEANLMWGGFRQTNLRNTRFAKANISYCDFDRATFDNTDFSNANLTASLLFNTNLNAANLKGANMAWAATHVSQLSEEGMKWVIEQLKKMGRSIPPDMLAHLQVLVLKIHEKKKQLEEMKSGYMKEACGEGKSVYAQRIAGFENDINELYNSFQSTYTQVVSYRPKQEKTGMAKYIK